MDSTTGKDKRPERIRSVYTLINLTYYYSTNITTYVVKFLHASLIFFMNS